MPASKINVDPRNLPFFEWAATVCADNASIPRPVNNIDWKTWANRVTEVDGSAPMPDEFNNWRDWGLAWINAV